MSLRIHRLSVLVLALAVSMVACRSDAPLEAADLAIRDVTVIDSASGFRANQTVLVRSGKVIAVHAAGSTAPTAHHVIDGRGRFLIPGLWDMHVHVTYDTAITEAMPDLFLRYGITSVRDTGGLLRELEPQVARWRAQGAIAPRLFYSGPLLDGTQVVYDGVGRPEIGTANPTADVARANVARLKQAGVDFVKIYELVSPEVFDALVSAAREADLPIAAHVPLAVAATKAGPSVDSMEHLRNVELGCARDAGPQTEERRSRIAEVHGLSGYDLRRALHAEYHPRARGSIDPVACGDLIAALVETIQVPTLRLNTLASHPPYERSDWLAHLDRLPKPARASWADGARAWAAYAPSADTSLGVWSMELVRRLHRAGVPIGAGTDTPIGSALPGYSLHTELERLVDAGLTPMDALTSATVRPAEFFGLEGEMGQVAPGHAADLVLLDANPLEDIRNTRAVRVVISRGRVVKTLPEESALAP